MATTASVIVRPSRSSSGAARVGAKASDPGSSSGSECHAAVSSVRDMAVPQQWNSYADRARGVLLSIAAVTAVTGFVFALRPVAPVLSLGVLYVIAVVVVAVHSGAWRTRSPSRSRRCWRSTISSWIRSTFVCAERLVELGRARRVPLDCGRRQRVGDTLAAACAQGGRGRDAPPERRREDGDPAGSEPRSSLAAHGDPGGERGARESRRSSSRQRIASGLFETIGSEVEAPRATRREPARPLAARGRACPAPARALDRRHLSRTRSSRSARTPIVWR